MILTYIDQWKNYKGGIMGFFNSVDSDSDLLLFLNSRFYIFLLGWTKLRGLSSKIGSGSMVNINPDLLAGVESSQ